MYAGFLDGVLPDGVELIADARLDGTFGAVMDGEDDAIEITTSDYSSDGTFTIAYWFQKSECKVPGRWETMFSHQHHADNATSRWWRGNDNPNIHM